MCGILLQWKGKIIHGNSSRERFDPVTEWTPPLFGHLFTTGRDQNSYKLHLYNIFTSTIQVTTQNREIFLFHWSHSTGHNHRSIWWQYYINKLGNVPWHIAWFLSWFRAREHCLPVACLYVSNTVTCGMHPVKQISCKTHINSVTAIHVFDSITQTSLALVHLISLIWRSL